MKMLHPTSGRMNFNVVREKPMDDDKNQNQATADAQLQKQTNDALKAATAQVGQPEASRNLDTAER